MRELVELLAIPNVASDRPNIRRNADHLRGMLARRGFAAELLETAGNPLVYGELRAPGAKRTLLLYAHYDGQPVDAKAWQQPDPFKPVLRTARVDQGGQDRRDRSVDDVRSRVAALCEVGADDKAPIVALCAALDVLKSSGLAPSVNLRVILDGEEEASSPSLVPAIGKYRDKFRADLMVILDGPIALQRSADARVRRPRDRHDEPDGISARASACTAATTATGFRIPRSASPHCSRA